MTFERGGVLDFYRDPYGPLSLILSYLTHHFITKTVHSLIAVVHTNVADCRSPSRVLLNITIQPAFQEGQLIIQG